MTPPYDVLLHQLAAAPDDETRWRAAFALGLGAPPHGPTRDAVVIGLAAALRDGAFAVRHNAAWALGHIGAHTAQDALAAALLRPDEDDEQATMMVALALARLGGRYAIDVLRQAAHAPSERVQRAAASALRARPWLVPTR